MKDVVIVDNSPAAYLFQPENALPIVSWYDDPNDGELLRLAQILERLAYEEDVRKVIRALVSNNKIDPKQEQIYLSMPTKHKRDQSHPATGYQTHHRQQPRNKPQEEVPEPASCRSAKNHESAQQQVHSRYESNDGRQKYAALIQEQLRVKKEAKQDTIEVMLQQVKDRMNHDVLLANQSKPKNSSKQTDNYDDTCEQHQFQIKKLQSELAAIQQKHQYAKHAEPHLQLNTSSESAPRRSHKSDRSLDAKESSRNRKKAESVESKSSRHQGHADRSHLSLQQHPQIQQHPSSSIQAFLQKQQISLSTAVGQNYSVAASSRVPGSTKVASKQSIAINNLAAGIATNLHPATTTASANNTTSERRSSSLLKPSSKAQSTEPDSSHQRGYSALVSSHNHPVDKPRERGHSAHLITVKDNSVQLRSSDTDQVVYQRSSSTHQQRGTRKPQILLSGGSSQSKASGSRTTDLQTTRTSRDSSHQSKKLVTTSSNRTGSQTKKSHSSAKFETSSMANTLNIKKHSQLNLGQGEKNEIDLRDILKLTTGKVGVSSTRHHGQDFISKLESKDKRAAQDATYLLRQQPGGHQDVNSPKYQTQHPQVLSDILNFNKVVSQNRQADQTDRTKKLKLVRSDATSGQASQTARKEGMPTKSSSRGASKQTGSVRASATFNVQVQHYPVSPSAASVRDQRHHVASGGYEHKH